MSEVITAPLFKRASIDLKNQHIMQNPNGISELFMRTYSTFTINDFVRDEKEIKIDETISFISVSEEFDMKIINQKDNINKLYLISEFAKDWNGYKADAFDEKTINNAQVIIESLNYQPQLFPTGRSTIQIEYDIDNDYLEFEIYNDKIEMYREVDENIVEEKIVLIDEIKDIVDSYYASK